MKTVHKARHSGDSCSCTTCVYKSESDHPSLRRIIDLGSRIDRLYYGKYIPLRERKLLERLVRTRAVYDDIRAQLVSDSSVSFSTRGDYNPKKKKSIKELDDTDKSSVTVLKLVNMVDRGAVGSTKLDDCCSCCSCSSKIKIHEHRHRQQRIYGGAEEYLARQERLQDITHRKKGVRFKTKHIRSDPCTCTYKLIKKHSKAVYKKLHQRPPFEDLVIYPEEGIKQNRNRIGDIARASYQNLIKSNIRMKEKISNEIANFRESQTRMQEKINHQTNASIEKINQAKAKIASKIKSSGQKLREVNKSAWPENELTLQLKKDSISKFKDELRKKQIMKDWECEPECIEGVCIPEKCFIKLKQKKINNTNVHHKGVRYNIKTQERKTGERFNHSNYKIQAQKLAKPKVIETNKPNLQAQQTRGIKVSSVTLDVAPKIVKKVGVTDNTIKKGHNKSTLKTIPYTIMSKKISVENVKAHYPPKKALLESSSLEIKSSERQAVRVGSSFSFNIEFYKDKPRQEIPVISSRSYTDSKQHPSIDYRSKKPVKEKKAKKKHLRQQSSQIEFKKSLKDTRTGGHDLKRCFCTLKLKAKANKNKIKQPLTKKIMTTETSTLFINTPAPSTLNAQTNTINKKVKGKKVRTKSNLLPYECEQGVCIPGECDPYQCIKLINVREGKRRNSSTQARKRRSTSSFTTRSYKPSKPKNVQSKVTLKTTPTKSRTQKQVSKRKNAVMYSPRQAVRIGSTFSFNVEFFKDIPKYQHTPGTPASLELKSLSIKPRPQVHRKVKLKDRGYQGNLKNIYRHTPTQIIRKEHDTTTQVIKKERNARIGTALKRCFCTLALQSKNDMKNHITKTLSTATETSELRPIDTSNKGTKTKLKYSRNSKPLKPYECEPNTCIPGACDPYICLERINVRKNRGKQFNFRSNWHEKILEPYECEPLTCIPGECDPYVCLERINRRNRHHKEVGLTADRSKTISTSSGPSYLEKRSKTARVQYKPRHREQKVITKTQKMKKYAEVDSTKYNVSKHPTSAPRQAVNIGSTFSFNIEFYKNQPPAHDIKQIIKYKETNPIVSGSKKSISKGIKMDKFYTQKPLNKGIKMNKLNVAHETQIKGPIKRDKGSGVGPMLKRCFCTLNLQKKWKHEYPKMKYSSNETLLFRPTKVYTVNRATILLNTQGIVQNKHKRPLTNLHTRKIVRTILNRELLNTTLSALSDNINVSKTNNALKLKKSKSENQINNQVIKMSQQSTNNSLQYLQKLEKLDQGTFTTSITREFSSSHLQETRLTSLTRYIKRCFFTMNLKVENIENFHENEDKGIKRKKHKLLPYECDPGFCIPGECNPYECQKMIAKRLMKGFSKKSGTEYSSRSISSSISQPISKSKEYKQQTLVKKVRTPYLIPQKNKTYHNTSNNDKKKAVRIGSSFSFDIQFSKKLTSPLKNTVLPRYSSDTTLVQPVKHLTKMKGTGIRTKNPDTQSQSASVKTVHKGTFAKPSIKRCFCTLKLQKKGRLHKEFKRQTHSIQSQTIIPFSELNKENTVTRGQNTKRVKPLKFKRMLEPYECEPYTCIPGQCDPYQCLQKIKMRNHQEEVGTNSILRDTKSISSTNTDTLREKMHRSRAAGTKPKKVTYKANNTHNKHYRESIYQKPLREAVRVGSSFSFNIEFFKDNPSHPQHTDTFVRRKSNDRRYTKELSPILKKGKDNYTESTSNLRNKKSQFENIARHASTLTNSFIKRCFCTAQFFKSNNPKDKLNPKRNEKPQSFLKRCYCIFKKSKPPQEPCDDNTCEEKLKLTHDKKINTHEIKRKPNLDLYECKPGICVPGECDPFMCDKIMRKYRSNNSKGTITGYPKTRTISSTSVNTTNRSVKTFMKSNEQLNSKHHRPKGRTVNTKTRINNPTTTSWSSDRNAVRVGSQFSFDIEFFKDHSHPSTKNREQRPFMHTAQVLDTTPKKKVQISSTKIFSPSYVSQSSQVKKKKVKDHGVGIHNFMKRCFCTLKLKQNNKHRQKQTKRHIDDRQVVKSVNTKSVMTTEKKKMIKNSLLPYECEPNFCIPYHCDPYECEKRIKLRNKYKLNREYGISTSLPKRHSAYSITDTNKLKTRSQSVMTKKFNTKVKRSPQLYSEKGKFDNSKQSVRIGSTFSFNIEFFKDKHHDGFELRKFPRKDDYRNNTFGKHVKSLQKNHMNQTNHRYKRMYTNQTQFDKKSVNESASQFTKPVMRTQSTVTALRERCFCTLSLKKSIVKSPVSVKTAHASTDTDFFRPAIQPVSNLLPYECEPNVCTPGQCNPVQCLERIKRRPGMLLPYECEPNVCVPGQCNPALCLERIKRRQRKLLPYECEPNICIPGECNPVQCLERIKKRYKAHGTSMTESQKKTFGTVMDEPKKSVSTIVKKRKIERNKWTQPKHFRNLNSEKIYKHKSYSDNNKQVVRIGSNFSFNMEFYKTSNPNYENVSRSPKKYKTAYHKKNKAAYSEIENKRNRNKALQSSSPKRVSQGSSISPFLKRCFCTLKLQNKHVKKLPTADKQISNAKEKVITSENKKTGPKKLVMEKNKLGPYECEPFYCVPGECDPYKCAKRIEMREKKHKTQYTITKSQTQSQKGIGVKHYNTKSQRSQTNVFDKHVIASKSNVYQPEIVEVPRFNNVFNKQAVRVGSNISFNIEFYKENLPLMSNNQNQKEHMYNKKLKENKILTKTTPKHIHHRHQNTYMTPLRSTGSEYEKHKTENKSVASENVLKRCFCTLKLQNITSPKSKNQNKPSSIQFPHNIEVRRLAVQYSPKMLSGKNMEAKSAFRKVTKKISKNNTNSYLPGNYYSCQNGGIEDMTTILPYIPEKFNKTVSKTVFPIENKCNKLRQSMIKHRGKRLTRKRSEKYLYKKQTKLSEKSYKSYFGIQKIIRWCAKKLLPKTKSHNVVLNENIRNNIWVSTDTMKPSNNKQQVSPNQNISKLKQCKQTYPQYLVYQSGDTKQWPPRVLDLNKENYSELNSLHKKSNTEQVRSKKKYQDKPCSCSNNYYKKQNTTPKRLDNNKKVRFLDTISLESKNPKANVENFASSKNKRFANGTKSDRIIQSSEYCGPCGNSKITKVDFHKASGDQPFIQKIVNKKFGIRNTVEKTVDKMKEKARYAMNSEEPLFEMHVDSGNYEILNRDEVIKNVAKLKTKCKPLIEVRVDPNIQRVLNKRAIIDDVRNANIKSKENSSIENVLSSVVEIGHRKDRKMQLCPCHHCTCNLKSAKDLKKNKLARNPCICGSTVCARKLKNIKTPITRHWKTCVCGSPICDSESAKIKALTAYVENKCLCQLEMEKRKEKLLAMKLKKEKKERELRLKLYEKSDKLRKEERKIEQKRLEKKIDRKSGDAVLLAESILDVGKFGITATADILRQAIRIARDPKHTIQTLRTLEENPMLIAEFLKSSYHDTGLNATLRRVRLRCLSMRGVIRLRQILESFPVTNYLLNIASNDPRRRLLKNNKKRRPKRERERIDFNCSLYMGSLRKRPYLSVYDRCPWFYQHFLSLVYAWKQFIDICLFLLAAVVWSPCILCMEICRACMCCFFCTG